MKKSLGLKFLIGLLGLSIVFVLYRYLWKAEINETVIMIALACILPITLLIRFPNKKS